MRGFGSRVTVAHVALLAVLTGCAGDQLPVLDARFEPLRAAFDGDAAHVRVLAILSPT